MRLKKAFYFSRVRMPASGFGLPSLVTMEGTITASLGKEKCLADCGKSFPFFVCGMTFNSQNSHP